MLMKGLVGNRKNGRRFSLRMFALNVLFFFRPVNLERDCSMTLISSSRWFSFETSNDAELWPLLLLLFMMESDGDFEKSSGDTDDSAGIDNAELFGETLLDGEAVVFFVMDMCRLPSERMEDDRECVLLFPLLPMLNDGVDNVAIPLPVLITGPFPHAAVPPPAAAPFPLLPPLQVLLLLLLLLLLPLLAPFAFFFLLLCESSLMVCCCERVSRCV